MTLQDIPRRDRIYGAVLFDMDGTLLDSRVVVERMWRDWAATHGLDGDMILAVSHGRRTIDTMADFAPAGVDVEAAAAAFTAREEVETAGVIAVPGAAALLAALPADRWAVVTSATRVLAVNRLTAAGLPLPQVMVAAEDVAQGKPDPACYRLAAARLGVAVEDCLVFEDAPAGIAAGQRAGADVVMVTGASPHPVQATVPSVADFRGLTLTLAG